MNYKNKYHSKKVEVDGIIFHSKKESIRYQELKLMELTGAITDLQLQVKFELIPKTKTERAINYIADFVYTDMMSHNRTVEDVKGFKTKEYIIKRKLFKYKYPDYIFIET